MAALNIELDDSDFELKLGQRLLSTLPVLPNRIVHEAAYRIESAMKQTVPVKTGKLQNSIGSTVTEGAAEGEASAVVYTSSGYGLFVDQGTRPHIIEGNPWLRFVINDRVVFARRVRHPGFKGRHFSTKAIRMAAGYIRQDIADLVSEALAGRLRS